MRPLLLALAALTAALPAAAQTRPAADTDAARVSRFLGAIWRPLPTPVTGPPAEAFHAACAGAIDEMAELELRLPEDLDPAALASVRAPQGLLIIPTAEDPSEVYIFPSAALGAVASGMGRFRLDPRGAGRVVLRDAAGGESELELGGAAGQILMRVRQPGAAEPVLFVGCAPTTN